jgi:hypothetical protein
MHDCGKTTERLVDLVFDELGSEARQHLLTEVEGCQDCLAQYRSMVETLHAYDRTMDAAMPDESYWAGYEERLRARLRLVRPNIRQRLSIWIGGLGFLIRRPIPAAAAQALILISIGWYWNWLHQSKTADSPSPPPIARATPSLEVKPREETTVSAPKSSEPRKAGSARYAKKGRPLPPVIREERQDDVAAVDSESAGPDRTWAGNSLFDPETLRHFERAQLLLRSFRNAVPTDRASIDLAYEKQFSRRLLYQNILLRRGAEARGNLPAEEVLESLEPVLLDIANLPERPSPDELSGIKQRLERKELIAELQLYSAPGSFPAYQGQ